MYPRRVGGKKHCSNGPGYMTNMAATPIYGKKPSKIFFFKTNKPFDLILGVSQVLPRLLVGLDLFSGKLLIHQISWKVLKIWVLQLVYTVVIIST